MRSANEIDFWRGLALVSIFINHIPGFTFERLTHRNYGLSDSAELFVFLAGWAMRLVATHATEPLGLTRLVLRLGARAVQLYTAQIVITVVALAMIATAAMVLENPLLLEWNNAAAVFQDPVPAHVGIVLLSHQLGYFDILPLYVVLMFGAPLLAATHRLAPRVVLPISATVYVAALTFQVDLPTWPVEGVWFFDPFAWQFIFVLGFAVAGRDGLGGLVRRWLPWLRPIGLIGVVVGAVIVLNNIEPDPTRVPKPTLLFVFDKGYLSPARILHFTALASAFAGTFRYIAPAVPLIAGYLSMLGRNSLNVFCVASLLSLTGQLLRVASDGSVAVDTIVLLGGVAMLGFTGWLSELRDRLRENPPVSPASS